jgi:hypothetical protein
MAILDAFVRAIERMRKRRFGSWSDRDGRRNATIEAAGLGSGADCAILGLRPRLLRNPVSSRIRGFCGSVERTAETRSFKKRPVFSALSQN